MLLESVRYLVVPPFVEFYQGKSSKANFNVNDDQLTARMSSSSCRLSNRIERARLGLIKLECFGCV